MSGPLDLRDRIKWLERRVDYLERNPHNAERVLQIGTGGDVPAAPYAEASDLTMVAPFSMLMSRLKATISVAASADTTIQVRRSTDDGATWSNYFGTVTILAGARSGKVNLADVDLEEDDLLQFSITAGNGTGENLALYVTGYPR